jgi:hypothetical protein
MPKKRAARGGLADKLGKALQSHARDETTYGPELADLPGGITGGIAQLVDAKIGQYKTGNNQGKDFVYLAGTVHQPTRALKVVRRFENGKVVSSEPESMVVQGLRTAQTIPLCDTARANGEVVELDFHVERLLNELRKLGGEDFTAGLSTQSDLEAALGALKEAGPFFRFSTSESEPTAQYPTSRVWENWNGRRGLEDYESDGDAGAGVEETAPARQTDTINREVEKAQAGEGPEDDIPFDEDDLQALGKAADEESNQDAANKLSGRAKLVGISKDAVDSAESWVEVAQMIEEASAADEGHPAPSSWVGIGERADATDEEGEPTEDAEEAQQELTTAAEGAGLDPDEYETWADLAASLDEAGGGEEQGQESEEPVKGNVIGYKPPRARKPINCEITAVFSGTRTVNLKSVDGDKRYKSVSWEKLES